MAPGVHKPCLFSGRGSQLSFIAQMSSKGLQAIPRPQPTGTEKPRDRPAHLWPPQVQGLLTCWRFFLRNTGFRRSASAGVRNRRATAEKKRNSIIPVPSWHVPTSHTLNDGQESSPSEITNMFTPEAAPVTTACRCLFSSPHPSARWPYKAALSLPYPSTTLTFSHTWSWPSHPASQSPAGPLGEVERGSSGNVSRPSALLFN